MKVLIVEDHLRLGRFIKQSVTEAGYIAALVGSCASAMDALAESNFDVVVLDLGLPDGDGLDLLQTWRQNGFNEPVIILSARDSVADRINGLDFGADDYLAKPFSSPELLARIRALVRRQSSLKLSVIEHRGLRLDLRNHITEFNGKALNLTSREFAILEVFMLNPGRVLSRGLIAEKVWPANFDIDMNLLDVYMSRLRGKLEQAAGQTYFKTLRGVGYQLI